MERASVVGEVLLARKDLTNMVSDLMEIIKLIIIYQTLNLFFEKKNNKKDEDN